MLVSLILMAAVVFAEECLAAPDRRTVAIASIADHIYTTKRLHCHIIYTFRYERFGRIRIRTRGTHNEVVTL